MDPVSDSVAPKSAAADIHFTCAQCNSPLVVNSAAAGMTLNCQICGTPTNVPCRPPPASLAVSVPVTDLQRQLKENESQRTEVTSYINQLAIQLHRWKIRLQTLNDRKADLEAQLSALEK